MNYQDMDATSQLQARHEVNRRAVELKLAFRNLILSVGTLLILLNSGGVVAILLNGQSSIYHIKISLFSFTFGVVASAIALMFLFMRTSKVDSSYAVDRNLFLNNQLSLSELRKNDGERCEGDYVEYILILLSFIGFISGFLYGVFYYF